MCIVTIRQNVTIIWQKSLGERNITVASSSGFFLSNSAIPQGKLRKCINIKKVADIWTVQGGFFMDFLCK